MNVNSLLYEMTKIHSMTDKKIDEREAMELKKLYILYLDKGINSMKKLHLK